MKYIKNFNESIDNESDIFKDVINGKTPKILEEILQEYVDEGFEYSIKYKLYKKYNDEYLTPTFTDYTSHIFSKVNRFNDDIKAYQISFKELSDFIIAADIQRSDNKRYFSTPSQKLYKFFDVTKDIQYRIESMGYTFTLSTHSYNEFDLLIIDKYETSKKYNESIESDGSDILDPTADVSDMREMLSQNYFYKDYGKKDLKEIEDRYPTQTEDYKIYMIYEEHDELWLVKGVSGIHARLRAALHFNNVEIFTTGFYSSMETSEISIKANINKLEQKIKIWKTII